MQEPFCFILLFIHLLFYVLVQSGLELLLLPSTTSRTNPGMLVPVWNLSAWVVEADRRGVRGHPWLQNKFKAEVGCRRPCLRSNDSSSSNNKNNKWKTVELVRLCPNSREYQTMQYVSAEKKDVWSHFTDFYPGTLTVHTQSRCKHVDRWPGSESLSSKTSLLVTVAGWSPTGRNPCCGSLISGRWVALTLVSVVL